VLSTGAAKCNSEEFKVTGEVVLNRIGYEAKGVLPKHLYLRTLRKVLDYVLVEPCSSFVALFSPRVWRAPTVKNKPSSVATSLTREESLGDWAFVREAKELNG
jgi:hypothetical protein